MAQMSAYGPIKQQESKLQALQQTLSTTGNNAVK